MPAAESGEHRAGGPIVAVDSSRLCPANPRRHTRKRYFFFPQGELSLSGTREDLRGQFGSRLFGIFWSDSIWPPWLPTAAPPTPETRTSPIPTQEDIRRICTEKIRAFIATLIIFTGPELRDHLKDRCPSDQNSCHQPQVLGVTGEFRLFGI